MKDIAKTLFLTSFLSYVVFLLAEYSRPGFVSVYFSVHWLLAIAVGSGVWWATYPSQETHRWWGRSASAFVASCASVILAVLVWKEGSAFQDVRVFMVLVALCVPWVVRSSYRS